MIRLAWIKCLFRRHRWGAWFPGYFNEGLGHHRWCQRCGAVQEHPHPRRLEISLRWYSACPVCGRRGMLVGSRVEGIGERVWTRPCIYICLECTVAEGDPLAGDFLRWERTDWRMYMPILS